MKYVKRPVVIDAEQFFPNQKPWPNGVYERTVTGCPSYRINTFEGEYVVSPGDWIITGVKGERYPCKPDIFEMTYEKVEGGM